MVCVSRPEDDFTSTVDGAAAYERWRGQDEHYDDRPTLTEAMRDAAEDDQRAEELAELDDDGEEG